MELRDLPGDGKAQSRAAGRGARRVQPVELLKNARELFRRDRVAAIPEADNGEIYTGFCIEACSGVMNLCAERVAGLNMYMQSGQTKVRRMIAFRDRPPCGEGSGMPCGACREFFYQLNEENEDMEILVDYAKRETVTLRELLPKWWGAERYEQTR